MSFMPGFRGTPKALKSVTLFAQAESTAASVTAPAGIIAGDILVLYDRAGNTTGSPSDVTPSGFTQIKTDLNGPARRSFSFKLADGSEDGTSISGINGTSANEKILAVLRGNLPAKTAALNSVVSSGLASVDPAPLTVTCGSGTPPMLALASYCSSGAITTRSLKVSGVEAKDGELASADVHNYIAWKLMTAALDVDIDMNNDGSNNCIQGAYLALTY